MNKELSLDVKPFKENGKALRVIACKKKNYINKKKWINWRISLHYEYFVEKKKMIVQGFFLCHMCKYIFFFNTIINFIKYVKDEEFYFR